LRRATAHVRSAPRAGSLRWLDPPTHPAQHSSAALVAPLLREAGSSSLACRPLRGIFRSGHSAGPVCVINESVIARVPWRNVRCGNQPNPPIVDQLAGDDLRMLNSTASTNDTTVSRVELWAGSTVRDGQRDSGVRGRQDERIRASVPQATRSVLQQLVDHPKFLNRTLQKDRTRGSADVRFRYRALLCVGPGSQLSRLLLGGAKVRIGAVAILRSDVVEATLPSTMLPTDLRLRHISR
jgi:hypothetical protein